MAIPTVQVTGSVVDPDAIGVTGGMITLTLSQSGSALDGAISRRVAASATWTLDATGNLPASALLVPNDAITPSGTAYSVRFNITLANGTRSTWTEIWQLASTPSPINIGAVPRLNVIPGVALQTSSSVTPIVATGSPTARTIGDRFGDVRHVEDFGAKGDDTTDDFAAIQLGIDTLAAGRGGVLLLGPKTYRVTDAPVMKNNVRLIGQGARVLYDTGANWWLRGGQLGVTGTVLHQVTAGKDGILVQAQDGSGKPLTGVGVQNLAIAFGGSINGSPQAAGFATGHGINVRPPTTGTGIRSSATSMQIGGIIVYGHDGDHYGWRLEGINESTVGSLVSYGGGGLLYKGPDGNSTFPGYIMVYWQNPGTAHGVFFDGPSAGAGNPLVYSSFAAIQSNADFGVGNTSINNLFRATGLYGGIIITMLDAENFSGSAALPYSDGSPLTVLGGSAFGVVMHSSAQQRNAFYAFQGTNPNFDGAFKVRIGSVGGTFPTTKDIWQVDYRAVQTINYPNGSITSPISCAVSTGIGGFNGGVALSSARAFLRIPSTAFTAGTPVTFYTYWDAATGSGPYGGSVLQLTPYTANGNDLGVQIGFRNNVAGVAKEMQITVYPLRTGTFAIDLVAEIAN